MKKLISLLLTICMLSSLSVYTSFAKEKLYNFMPDDVLIYYTNEGITNLLNDYKSLDEFYKSFDFGFKKQTYFYRYENGNASSHIKLNKRDHENVLYACKILRKSKYVESADPNGIAFIAEMSDPFVLKDKFKLNAGETEKIEMGYGDIDKIQSKNKKVAIVKKNKITALNKGKCKIVITDNDLGQKAIYVTVKNSPKLVKDGKTVKSITVKSGYSVNLKIKGKAKKIKNKFTNSKQAKITSSKKSAKLTVKGLKKGTSTLKIKVNGVKTLKLKVTVV